MHTPGKATPSAQFPVLRLPWVQPWALAILMLAIALTLFFGTQQLAQYDLRSYIASSLAHAAIYLIAVAVLICGRAGGERSFSSSPPRSSFAPSQ